MCAPLKVARAWCVDRCSRDDWAHENRKAVSMARVEAEIIEEAEQALINAGIQATREQYSDRLNFLMMLFLNAHKKWRMWRKGLQRYRDAARRGNHVKLPPYPQKLVNVLMQQTVSQLRLEFPEHSRLPALIPLQLSNEAITRV